MAKNDWVLPVVLIGGAAIWLFKFGGKEQIEGMLGGGSSSGMDGMPTVDGIGAQVQSMIDKIKNSGNSTNNFNYDSGKNSQVNTQSNTGKGGKITQTRNNVQKSTSFFTMPRRFGNL
jgi:hypothetical protein